MSIQPGEITRFEQNRWSSAMDGSVQDLELQASPARLPPAPEREPLPEHLPEREWGLSAGQVTAAVLAIVAFSELVGLLN